VDKGDLTMYKKFKAVVFEPNKEGQVVDITPENFRELVDGWYQVTHNKHDIADTSVIVNEEGALVQLPYNRGYYGTFIVVKERPYTEDGEEEEYDGYMDLTDDEIKEVKEELDSKPNFTSPSKYLNTFFEEKQLPIVMLNYNINNVFVNITNYDAIEVMMNQFDVDTLKQAENIIRKIDFANGDVNHFLEHIGRQYATIVAEKSNSFGW